MQVRAPTRTAPAPMPATFGVVATRCRTRLIAVTGTSGKSTAGAVVASALRASGYRVAHATRAIADRDGGVCTHDYAILECPLAGADAMRDATMIVATGLSPDELAPDETAEAAMSAVAGAMSSATHAVVLNADSPALGPLARCVRAPIWRASATDHGAEAALIDETIVCTLDDGARERVCRLGDAVLRSPAIAADLLVASAAAAAAGATPLGLATAIRQFVPQPDCQELVAVRGGVRWVSDARATRPGRTVAALAAASGPVLLVAGGEYGGQPLEAWALAAARSRFVLLFGTAAGHMAAALRSIPSRGLVVRCSDLDDAVVSAACLARRGDAIVFSPGCEATSGASMSPAERFRDLAAMPRASRAEAA